VKSCRDASLRELLGCLASRKSATELRRSYLSLGLRGFGFQGSPSQSGAQISVYESGKTLDPCSV